MTLKDFKYKVWKDGSYKVYYPEYKVEEFIRRISGKMKEYLDNESDLPKGTYDEDINFLFKEESGFGE